MNSKQLLRILLSILMTTLMVLCAEMLHEKEIIFPEISALLIGAWASAKQPWKVDKIRFVLVMSISAFMGIIIVRYISIPLYFQIMFALAYAMLAVMVSKTSMVPLISACVLPVIMQTETIIYPISVFIMSMIIVGVQWLLEYSNIREKIDYQKVEMNKEELFIWLKRYVLMAIYVLLATQIRPLYLIAPPLFVCFVELSNPYSHLREKSGVILFLMISASLIGYFARCLNMYMGLTLTLSACIGITLLFIVFHVKKLMFPPAGAIVLLPMILPVENLYYYPIFVSISSLLLIGFALVLFRKDNTASEDEDSAIDLLEEKGNQ